MPELRGRLVDMGVSQADLASLQRWDLVHLIKELASKAVKDDVADDMQKFARKAKVTGFMKAEDYTKQAAGIWKSQVNALKSTMRHRYDSGSDDNSDDDFEGEDDLHDTDNEEDYSLFSGDRTSEAAELNALKDIAAAQNVEFPTVGGSSSGDGVTDGNRRTLQDIMGPDWVRPAKAVKKIERYIRSDGSECVRVKFILTPSEVTRVERENIKNKTGKYGILPQVGAARSELVRGRSRTDSITDSSATAASAPPAVSDKSNRPLRQKESIHSNFQMSSKPADLQLYKFEFNARLEKMLMEVYAWPSAVDFRYPVPHAVPDYHTIIAHPMSLSDIQRKLHELHYSSLSAFMSDIRLMASNAAKFNGRDSYLAINANKIVQHLQSRIDYDSTHQLRDLLRELEANVKMVELKDAAEIDNSARAAEGVDGSGEGDKAGGDDTQDDDLFGSDSDSGEEEVMESSHLVSTESLQHIHEAQMDSSHSVDTNMGVFDSCETEEDKQQTEMEIDGPNDEQDTENLFGDDSDDDKEYVQDVDM